MKRIWIYIVAAACIAITVGCDNPSQPTVTSCDCIDNPEIDYPYVPSNRYYAVKRSVDGSTLAYLHSQDLAKLYLYSINTGEQTVLEFALPRYYSVYRIIDFHWCPYDHNKLLINTVTTVDFGDRMPAYTSNAFIVDKTGTTLNTVTPPLYPWFGAPPNSLHITAWLPGSTPEADSLLVDGAGIYVPQKEQFLPQYWDYSYLDRLGTNNLQLGLDTESKRIILGGFEFDFQSFPDQWQGTAAFSPSGSNIVFDGSEPYQQPCARTLYIGDVGGALSNPGAGIPLKELSPRKLFCMNHYDNGSVFITDTTIAVSMYHDGDQYAHYYEVSITGALLRRISSPR